MHTKVDRLKFLKSPIPTDSPKTQTKTKRKAGREIGLMKNNSQISKGSGSLSFAVQDTQDTIELLSTAEQETR